MITQPLPESMKESTPPPTYEESVAASSNPPDQDRTHCGAPTSQPQSKKTYSIAFTNKDERRALLSKLINNCSGTKLEHDMVLRMNEGAEHDPSGSSNDFEMHFKALETTKFGPVPIFEKASTDSKPRGTAAGCNSLWLTMPFQMSFNPNIDKVLMRGLEDSVKNNKTVQDWVGRGGFEWTPGADPLCIGDEHLTSDITGISLDVYAGDVIWQSRTDLRARLMGKTSVQLSVSPQGK